jgi:hypothetical protein
MDAPHAQRIEGIANFGASAILAGAMAYAVGRSAASTAAVAAAAVAAFFVALVFLRSISPKEREFQLAPFVPTELTLEDSDELLLTEEDRVDCGSTVVNDELLLDDVLAQLEEESRVVRLFDSSATPTPGQLRTRIDRHLDQTRLQDTRPDASEALHEALAELRRSLK